MIRRLRAKFICTNMALVTVTLIVIFGMVFHVTKNDLRDQNLRMMEKTAKSAVIPKPPYEPESELKIPYFIVSVADNGLAQIICSHQFDVSDTEYVEELVCAAVSGKEHAGEIGEYNLRYFRDAAPFGTVVVFSDISGESDAIRSLLRVCTLIGLLSFALFLVISMLLARWAVRPVERAWKQQRQFVADASHELKTPLTVILTNAEMLQNEEFGEAEQRKFRDSILAVSRQMRGLVEGLLDLARVDNGAVRSSFERLNASELVEETALQFEAVYFERDLELLCEITPGIEVRGSERYLRQLIEILLDNAGKYAEGGREVTLSFQHAGRNQCRLCVSNHAAALTEQQLKDIFKRFYRVDEVRKMSGSYGLGLSIAESIVRDHQGRIWAEYENGRIRISVQLPAG
ncbi:MAG: HAMP domain-containing histidine kinase [Oscillospiraceae bacterium]|nr:HAMP domain-containing histidine kinase [Oscillospiraceae bacterium]